MAETTKLEFNALTASQKEFYGKLDTKSGDGNGEESSSYFTLKYTKPLWNSQSTVRLNSSSSIESTKDGEKERMIVYELPPDFHVVMYSYMVIKFPTIKVKDKYKNNVRICWPHNLALAPIKKADHTYGTQKLPGWDYHFAVQYFQSYMKPGTRDAHNVAIGNIPSLEEWSTQLHEYETFLEHPWFYSRNAGLAFPLYLCNSTVKNTHNYIMRLSIKDLLRMQIKDIKSGEWTDCKVVTSVLEGIKDDSEIPTPELYSRCATMTQDEANRYKCQSKIVIYADDIVECDAKNTITMGKSVSIDLNSTKPCKALFWVAENKSASDFHCFSNYTTDPSNTYNGYNPIKSVSLYYGSTPQFEKRSSGHFSLIQHKFHAISPPCLSGFHMLSVSHFPYTVEPDISIIYKNLSASLVLDIADTNPYIQKSSADSDDEKLLQLLNDSKADTPSAVIANGNKSKTSTDKTEILFIPRVRMLVTTKLTFTKSATGDTFSLEIE
jgi:hypothetical protein